MDSFLPQWLDQFLRNHPALMIGLVFVAALAATLTLIASGAAIVAYEGF